VQLVAQHAEHARLAGAVGADQTDFVAGVERQVSRFEQLLGAAHQADVGKTDHNK
jgi:hypothetical protein